MKVQLLAIILQRNNYLLKNKHLKLISCFIILLFSIHNSFGIDQLEKDNNVIDLKKIVILKNTEIALDTGWEFYWNQLILPGHFKTNKPSGLISLTNWTKLKLTDYKLPSFGYATYRLKISIPKERTSTSLYIPRIFSSSKTWVNGKLISEIGNIGKSKEETLHRRFSQIVPLNTHETDFEIVIQVANFYHKKGGINTPLILGNSQHLYTLKYKQIIADMIFIGCLGFIGFFFLLFYLFYWNKDQAVLYFAILCISLSYMALSDRYAPFTKIFESISWIFLTRIEYTSLFLAGTAASLFFNDIFTNFIHKYYSKVITYSFYILSVLVLFLPPPYFSKLLLPFFILMIINLIYVTLVIIKAIIGKHESVLLLISMLLSSIVFVAHIFFFLEKNEFVIIYVNFGYIFAFLLLSMLLMNRFSNSFKELEQAKELAVQQKKEISIKSNQLSNANIKLEENLRLLENYNTELDDFNHIVSHDLKSPLVSVYSLVSFIEEDLKNTLDEGTKYHIKLLKDVVSKMEALINGLLQYSKVAKGNKRKELFSLNELLKQVISVVDYQNNSTINLPAKNLEIYTSKIELEHVFQNLISNSIKHNDKERAIITISVSKNSNEYLFSVSDNGPGIDPEYHTKIFKIFSQLKVNDDVESTGIGLAIVKKIITENYGIISVESEKGIGVKINFSWRI